MLLDVVVLTIGFSILITGGTLLVKGAKNIATRLHIKPLIIGLTVVAFGTSCPELFVSIQSVLAGHHDMTMGSIIGSNICNIALVLGLTAIFSNVNVSSEILKIDWPMAMGSSFLMYILILEGWLKTHEGVVFVIVLITYITFLAKRSKKHKAQDEKKNMGKLADNSASKNSLFTDIGSVILGCFGLYSGSEWFLIAVKDIFHSLGVSERITGIFVLAVGTSLPELVTSIISALKNDTDLALGNLMGSNIFNVLSILGITSIIREIRVSEIIKNHDIIWMLAITLALFPLMLAGKKLGKIHGSILLAIYIFYIYSIY